MKRFYSESTQTSYLLGIHPVMPPDAVEISEALYLSVIGNPPAGKVRAHDKNGLPYLVDAPVKPRDPATQERNWRDQAMLAAIGLRDRHRDQLEIGGVTTLSSELYSDLLLYIQALRDWPQSPDFPDTDHRPLVPDWIAGQTE